MKSISSSASVDFLLPKTQRINDLTIEAVQGEQLVPLLIKSPTLCLSLSSLPRGTPYQTDSSHRSQVLVTIAISSGVIAFIRSHPFAVDIEHCPISRSLAILTVVQHPSRTDHQWQDRLSTDAARAFASQAATRSDRSTVRGKRTENSWIQTDRAASLIDRHR